MEAYQITVNLILMELSNSSSRLLLQKIIRYLQPFDIKAISIQAEKSNTDHTFLELLRIHHFIYNYLNRVDRTFYYTFYESQEYINIEQAQIRLLTQNISGPFLDYSSKYRKCFKFIQALFPQQVNPQELVEQIELMITDIQIPMPKLKRENQGIFCKTAFQNFLVHLKFKNQCFSQYQSIFQSLNIYFSRKEETYLQKLFMKALKDKVLSKKVRFLRFTPFQITFENFENYLVERNSLHNFLISLFAITDVWLNSIKCYLGSIQDPFHRYIQLITRYSIYRNFVISVEENFSFVFEQYNDLYEEVFGGNKPKFRFWRSALTKWLLKFEQYHSELNSIYYIYLTKLRTDIALQFLQEKEQESPQIYMSIKNKMTLREYQSDLEALLLPDRMCNGIENFFDKDKQLTQLILVQYMQYMIDLSINEETVHWCGHSEQILSEPYLSFEKYILAENKINLPSDQSIKNEFQLNFYQKELSFFQQIEMKPVTLKKIFQSFNEQFDGIASIQNKGLSLTYNFRENDEILKYFNQKANVKYQLTSQEAYFYSIKPLLSSEQLLTKSTNSTEVTQEEIEEEEQEQEDDQICEDEYFSQNSQTVQYQSIPQNSEGQRNNKGMDRIKIVKNQMKQSLIQRPELGNCELKNEEKQKGQKQQYLLLCRIKDVQSKQASFHNKCQSFQQPLEKQPCHQDSTKENNDLSEDSGQVALSEIKCQIIMEKNQGGSFEAGFSSKIDFYSIDI